MSRARIVSIVGASGGVGASVLTAALAVNAQGRVLAVDGRPFGGGLDLVFGVEEERGFRWPDLAEAAGASDGARLLSCLPACGDVSVLAFDRQRPTLPSADTIGRIVGTLAAHVDVVVVDAARIGEEAYATYADLADDVIALVGGGLLSMASAKAVAPVLHESPGSAWVAVRARRGVDDLPGAVAASLQLPFLGPVPDDRGVESALSCGRAPGRTRTLRRAAEGLLVGLDLGVR